MKARAPIPAIVGVFLGAAIALVLSALVIANSNGVLDGPWTYLPTITAVTMPAVLGAIGLRRPRVLLAAATMSLPLAGLSLTGATLPLIVPGVLYLVGYARSSSHDSPAGAVLIGLLGLGLGLSAFIPLTTTGEEVCAKTIRYPGGRTETVRVAPSGAMTLDSRVDGGWEVSIECQETLASWAGPVSLATAVAGVALIAFLGNASGMSYRSNPLA
jgi:hypothetical protein